MNYVIPTNQELHDLFWRRIEIARRQVASINNPMSTEQIAEKIPSTREALNRLEDLMRDWKTIDRELCEKIYAEREGKAKK